ncbi:MAG: MarR family transcriptional regulator [Bryobacteraceae bacterium]
MVKTAKRNEQKVVHLAQEIDRDLRVIREILRRPVETEFARGELTGPQRSIMQLLTRSDGLSLKELSKQAGLAHSTVSGIIDRLEKRGMVERQQSAADARFTTIAVSEEVRTFLRDTLPALTIHPLVEALRGAKSSERKSIVKGLRALRRLLEAE